MKLPLLKPKATMAALIAGISSLGGMCLTTVGGLAPLADKHGLEVLRPWILGIDTVLGVIAGVCIVLSAIGRSIASRVDHCAQVSAPQGDPEPPATADTLALPEGTMVTPNSFEQLLGKALDGVVTEAEANKAKILAFVDAQGLTLENVAEKFLDAEIQNVKVSGILSVVPRDLVIAQVNRGIEALIAAGKSRDDTLFDLVVGKIQSAAKALGG